MRRLARSLPLLLALGATVAAAQQDPRALLVAGGEALAAGDLEEAERQFDAARRLDPELAVAWLGLADARERQGRVEEALPLARRAQQLAPGEAVVHRAVGRLLAQVGADDEALEALAEARRLAPDQPAPYLLAGLLLRRNGRTAEAAGLLGEALEAGADGAELRRELVLLLLADGRPGEAIPAAEAAVARFPGVGTLQLALGLALAAEPDRRAEAPAWLERALAAGVERPERVRLELGSVLLDLGRVAPALEHLEAAAKELAAEPTAWYRLARARQASGDAEGAAAALERFRQLGSERDEADHAGKRIATALNEAQALAAGDRLPEALARVRELLAESPGLPRALALEAKVLYSLRRTDEALASVRAAAAAVPGAVEYRYLEGVFLAESGRAAEAEAAFERALDLEPDLVEAWDHLGRLALADSRPGEAAERFERALELGAESPAVRLFYSEALERLGRLEESAAQMEAYRRLVRGSGTGP